MYVNRKCHLPPSKTVFAFSAKASSMRMDREYASDAIYCIFLDAQDSAPAQVVSFILIDILTSNILDKSIDVRQPTTCGR